jgi:hypothetical protein
LKYCHLKSEMVFSHGNTKEKLLTTGPLLEVETYFRALVLCFWKQMFPLIDLCQWSQMVPQFWIVKTLTELHFARKIPPTQTFVSYCFVSLPASCIYNKKFWENNHLLSLIHSFVINLWTYFFCVQRKCEWSRTWNY